MDLTKSTNNDDLLALAPPSSKVIDVVLTQPDRPYPTGDSAVTSFITGDAKSVLNLPRRGIQNSSGYHTLKPAIKVNTGDHNKRYQTLKISRVRSNNYHETVNLGHDVIPDTALNSLNVPNSVDQTERNLLPKLSTFKSDNMKTLPNRSLFKTSKTGQCKET